MCKIIPVKYEYQINNLNNLKLNDNIKENQFKRNYTSNTYNPNISRSNYKYNKCFT